MTRGVFITLEGGEGSGKSTQARLLAHTLETQGIAVTATREPGGAPGAEQIRALLVNGETGRWDALSEALLHYAARREHLRHTILPALAGGRWVICDRFADSTMAYQGYGHGLGREVIAALHAAVVGDLAPDLTLILDLPVVDGLGRAASRGGEDRYERMDRTFHERLREGFLDIARRDPGRCAVIDATGTVEQVQAAIIGAVHERLGVNAP
ncbi:MAG: dTMP kinase [Rhodospirillales bacterium]|jgi:dTMP kinase|nr:dTMP kinase [Rhodospirillales bacterium]